MKYEVAGDMGVNLKNGYNGDLPRARPESRRKYGQKDDQIRRRQLPVQTKRKKCHPPLFKRRAAALFFFAAIVAMRPIPI
jgi:hypothetical protein